MRTSLTKSGVVVASLSPWLTEGHLREAEAILQFVGRLKDFATANAIALRKISKKYDKTVNGDAFLKKQVLQAAVSSRGNKGFHGGAGSSKETSLKDSFAAGSGSVEEQQGGAGANKAIRNSGTNKQLSFINKQFSFAPASYMISSEVTDDYKSCLQQHMLEGLADTPLLTATDRLDQLVGLITQALKVPVRRERSDSMDFDDHFMLHGPDHSQQIPKPRIRGPERSKSVYVTSSTPLLEPLTSLSTPGSRAQSARSSAAGSAPAGVPQSPDGGRGVDRSSSVSGSSPGGAPPGGPEDPRSSTTAIAIRNQEEQTLIKSLAHLHWMNEVKKGLVLEELWKMPHPPDSFVWELVDRFEEAMRKVAAGEVTAQVGQEEITFEQFENAGLDLVAGGRPKQIPKRAFQSVFNLDAALLSNLEQEEAEDSDVEDSDEDSSEENHGRGGFWGFLTTWFDDLRDRARRTAAANQEVAAFMAGGAGTVAVVGGGKKPGLSMARVCVIVVFGEDLCQMCVEAWDDAPRAGQEDEDDDVDEDGNPIPRFSSPLERLKNAWAPIAANSVANSIVFMAAVGLVCWLLWINHTFKDFDEPGPEDTPPPGWKSYFTIWVLVVVLRFLVQDEVPAELILVCRGGPSGC